MPHKSLTKSRIAGTTTEPPSPSERAKHLSQIAKRLIDEGEYESAREALIELWPSQEKPPIVEGLDPAAKAEVLLRVGVLAGWIGAADQTPGAQEKAKDLISQSIKIFDELGATDEAAEARTDLAYCYWREGGFDEGRIIFGEVIGYERDIGDETKAVASLRWALLERKAGKYNDSLEIYKQAAALIERTGSHALKGKLHNGLGMLFHCLALGRHSEEEFDRALVEFAGASFHFEQAGHNRHCARVENNLGYLLFTVNKFKEAHGHLNRARRLFVDLHDLGAVAQVDDTRAKAMLAEGRDREAERLARSSVKTLERGGEQALLAEALTTYGVALARTGKNALARITLQRGAEIAQTAGDLEGAGRAQLSLIEELGEQTAAKELVTIYQSAAELFKQSQDPSSIKRLVACASKVIESLGALIAAEETIADQNWEGVSFKQQVVLAERKLIERALREAGGVVTRAARLLGFKHHQSLISLINTRHKELLKTRSAVRKRRRHLFSGSAMDRRNLTGRNASRAKSQVSILYVEDNASVSDVVKEMLVAENWRVDLCTTGSTAVKKLGSQNRYDLLLFDNELPNLSGLELVRRARKMPHRRRTPIIIISGSDCETEAWSAGVDAFLRKPDDIEQVPSTITRVLKTARTHN